MDKYPRGVILSDGNVLWIVDDIRDGLMVGSIGLDYVLKSGRVKGNGALLQRTSYPRLFKWVQDNAAVQTTEANWSITKHLFTLGDGSTTFRVPDLRGKWLQISDSVGALAAGLPNATGNTGLILNTGYAANTGSGALSQYSAAEVWNHPYSRSTGAGILLDLSKSSPIYGASNTVQPPSIQLIAQIKY